MTLAFYLLKVIACSGILFIYYQFALKNKVFHQWNRFYLLFAVCLSILLPLMQFTIDSTTKEPIQLIRAAQSADNYLQGIVITSGKNSASVNWWLISYCSIGCLLFCSLLLSVYKIMRMTKKWDVQLVQNVKFLNTTEAGTPFSFLNYIFWNRDISLQTEAGQTIFRHELVHVEEKHTCDKLFIKAVISTFWCNPFFWLIKKELRFIHEFIADKKAVGQNGTAAFAAMILQASYPLQYNSITNPFFQTSIKRRLAMLTKIQNPVLNYISRVIALPLIAITVFAFTIRTKKQDDAGSTIATNTVLQTDTIPKKQKEIAEINVKHDRILEIFYADGTSETMTEAEAIKKGLVNNGGFVNRKRGEERNLPAQSDWIHTIDANPIYILDGKEITKETLSAIDPKMIESVNVLKGATAIAKYSDKGKNGVVEIYLKKQPSGEMLTIKENDKPVMKGEITKLEFKDKNVVNLEAKVVTVEGHPMKKKEVMVDGYPLDNKEVEVEEQPADKKEVVVIGHPIKKESKEIVVTGHQMKKNESIFTKTEEEASIDLAEWRKFLRDQALPIVEKATSVGATPGQYVVNVRFIVNTDGTLSEATALNDPGYGIASGIVSVMDKSPKWTPAKQNGKVVRSYHVQPVMFQIANQN